ncbi:hypothetical protein CEXT_760441, partial [Caerostris extrusa]
VLVGSVLSILITPLELFLITKFGPMLLTHENDRMNLDPLEENVAEANNTNLDQGRLKIHILSMLL